MVQTEDLVKWRRIFHQYPELSEHEFETTKRIKEILELYDIHILDLPLKTGLVAEIGRGD